ncbi:MAG: 30S ribosomal protein S12 methylthiotransferase RimO [Gammaproteobacteria bacterium]|nr:30S ribosomal protein S12 methylthiotransferase RimO [Gammaproteobacteria bacterium]
MNSNKVGFISLGCPKALVDSERILTQLRIDGYDIVPTYEEADVVVVNTCGFIDSARAESLEAIGEAIDANGRVIVTGCLGVHEEQIRSVHPGVLSVTGPQQYEQVVGAVHRHLPISKAHDPFTELVPAQGIKLTPRHYAYLKISEGCNHKCSFCIIPSMRGPLVSRSIDDVMREAEGLVRAGVRELLVISQDTSAYGSDIRYRTGFWNGRPLKSNMHDLCEALGTLGIWIRLHYVYPYPHVDNIIPLMDGGKILPYLDIPFQHGSPKILKAMRRPAATENTLNRITMWRQQCPELVIRSTFIVGFPGETETDFQLLLDFLREAQLDRVGCFEYSPVSGAIANELDNPVPDELKSERYERFMQLQSEISANKLKSRIGETLEVLVDRVEGDVCIGRSYADAPEIDGLVYLTRTTGIQVADAVTAEITDASEYDLYGTPVFQNSENQGSF